MAARNDASEDGSFLEARDVATIVVSDIVERAIHADSDRTCSDHRACLATDEVERIRSTAAENREAAVSDLDRRVNALKAYEKMAMWADKTLPLDTKVLETMPDELKLHFGAAFIGVLISQIYNWLRVYPQANTDCRRDRVVNFLTQWARLVANTLLSCLGSPDDHIRALSQFLEVHLPGHVEGQDVSRAPSTSHHIDELVAHKRLFEYQEARSSDCAAESSPDRGVSPPIQHLWIRELIVRFVLSSTNTPVWTARTRRVVTVFAGHLGICSRVIEFWERDVGKRIQSVIMQSDVAKKAAGEKTRASRAWKVGLATVGGGALLAVTGGLAAPFVASGLASVGGTLAGMGAVGATVGGVIASGGLMFSTLGVSGAVVLFGASGASLTGIKMAKRMGDLSRFRFVLVSRATADEVTRARHMSEDDRKIWCEAFAERLFSESHLSRDSSVCGDSEPPSGESENLAGDPPTSALHVVICVSGWLSNGCEADFVLPWAAVTQLGGGTCETYSLCWEPRELGKFTYFLLALLAGEAAKQAASLWLQYALTGGLATSTPFMWPLWVVRSLSDIDNTWALVAEKSQLAGKALALAVLDRAALGNARPVSLIGFGMGARVVYYALLDLWKEGHFGLVNDVGIFGAPVPSSKGWHKIRSVAAGRVINGYLPSDWVLGLLYRYMEWALTVAGLVPVEVDLVENYDLSELLCAHHEYADAMPAILQHVNWGDLPEEATVAS